MLVNLDFFDNLQIDINQYIIYIIIYYTNYLNTRLFMDLMIYGLYALVFGVDRIYILRKPTHHTSHYTKTTSCGNYVRHQGGASSLRSHKPFILGTKVI